LEEEANEVLQSSVITGVDDFHSLLSRMETHWESSKREWPNLHHYYRGCVYYLTELRCYTSICPSEREFPSRVRLWMAYLENSRAATVADRHISLFVLGWNYPQYRYYKQSSLLSVASKIIRALKQSSPPKHFNHSPNLSSPPEVPNVYYQHVSIRASRVHGWGLFAARSFEPEETIITIRGRWLSSLEYKKQYPTGRKPRYLVQSLYCREQYLCAGAPGKFLNSPPPEMERNSALEETPGSPASHGTIVLVAKKHIEKGEEILAHYHHHEQVEL
jgi:hypothetical protein